MMIPLSMKVPIAATIQRLFEVGDRVRAVAIASPIAI